MGFRHFQQLDQMDCGPTCLQMVAHHYGRYHSLKELRKKSFITREGVSLLGISDAAESIGFRTLGVKVPLDILFKEAPFPCIVHWNQRHFVVVYRVSRSKVHVADPAAGLVTYTKEEFKKGWLSTNENGKEVGVALLLEPAAEFHNREDNTPTRRKKLSFLFNYLRGHQRLFFQLILGLLTVSLIQLALPFLTQSIVDVGINTQNIQFIYIVLAGQMMLFISKASVEFTRRWILLHISTRINIAIISDFLIKLYKLPLPFFEGKRIGDILRRIDDHSRLEKFLGTSSLNFAFSLFNIFVFGIVLVIYSIKIFLAFFGMSALYVLFILLFMKRRAELDYKRFQQMADNQSGLIQTIQGMNEIKMNNCETMKRWEWERIQARLFRLSVHSASLQQYQDAGGLLINETKNMAVTILAAMSVLDGQMTLGMMLAVQYIVGQLNAPVNEFVGFSRDLQDARISMERIGEIHSQSEEEMLSTNGTSSMFPIGRTLSIEGLSFCYEGPRSPRVLEDLDLVIPEGKVTAIVGASGSGKTTLMKLLMKFYAPSEGRIRLAGEDIKNVSTRLWRKRCGVVMQDGFIFSDSIARNIALSTEQIDMTKLMQATRLARIDEFIESLPLGYNTKVGPNGIGLSQGQKQRILIARAAYKDPEFIFMDEATSSLDANNEKVILQNLNAFFQGRTVLVIAHRLSTVKNADQIVVLEKGRIVEVGNHAELTKTRGQYFELVKNQLELGV